MSASRKLSALVLAAALAGNPLARGQEAPANAYAYPLVPGQVLDNAYGYRHVYQTSQSLFDGCDDAVRGDLYRKVVREKINRCPFSDAEKAAFQSWAAAQSARIAEENRQAHAAGLVPATPELLRACKEGYSTHEMRDIQRRLDRYGRGQLTAEGVIEERCEPEQP